MSLPGSIRGFPWHCVGQSNMASVSLNWSMVFSLFSLEKVPGRPHSGLQIFEGSVKTGGEMAAYEGG